MCLPAGRRNLGRLVVGLDHEVRKRAIRARYLAVRNLEHEALGLVDSLFRIERRIVGKLADLSGGFDELSEERVATHDLGMVLPVGKRDGVAHKLENVRLAAHRRQLIFRSEEVHHRNGIDGNGPLVHGNHRNEELAVRRAIEVVDPELGDGIVHHVWRKQHGREHVGLGLGVIGKALMGPTVYGKGGVIIRRHAHSFLEHEAACKTPPSR